MFQRQRDQQARNYTAARNTVSIPAVIPCNCCKIKKPQSAFSGQKLNELGTHMKNTPKFRADLQPYIPCIGCSPKQVVELHCHFCDKDKGVDKFSKAQRKKPDQAECWDCAKLREEMEPGESDDDVSEGSRAELSDDDDDNGEDYSFAPTSSRAGGSTMPGTFSSRNTSGGGVSLPGTSSHAPTSSTGGWADSAASTTSSSTVHGDGFTTITNRSSKQAASSSSGFNPNKYKPAPSVASSSRGRGQWAKVPAVKKSPAKKDSDDESEDDVYLSGSDSN